MDCSTGSWATGAEEDELEELEEDDETGAAAG